MTQPPLKASGSSTGASESVWQQERKREQRSCTHWGSTGLTHEEWLHGCTGELGQWIVSVHRKKRKCLWWASSQSLPQCPITASIGIPQRPNLMCWTVEYFPYISPLKGETLTWWEHSVMKLSFHMLQSLLPLSASRFPTLLVEKKKKRIIDVWLIIPSCYPVKYEQYRVSTIYKNSLTQFIFSRTRPWCLRCTYWSQLLVLWYLQPKSHILYFYELPKYNESKM